MSIQERYIASIHDNVLASPDHWATLESDLRAHFDAGAEEGRTPAQTIDRLGTSTEVAASFMAERPLDYAGFWIRALAFATDLAFLFAVSLPFAAVLIPGGRELERATGNKPLLFLVLLLLGLGLAGLWVVYFPLVEARFGKTLGKQLLRLRVVQESGIAITAGKAILRRLPLYFDIIAIDALFAPFTKKKQRAFDIVAKTIVVHEPGRRAGTSQYLLCAGLTVAIFAGFLLVTLFMNGCAAWLEISS